MRSMSRSRVGGGRRCRDRSLRLGLEALEPRVVLSAQAPAWVNIGPAPINDPFDQNLNFNGNYVSPPQITGAIQTVATYETPQGTVGAYVGAPLGGVWQTQDLLASVPTWSTQTDGMPSLAINSLAVSPLDPTGATVFAGTGATSNGGLYWSGFGPYPDLSLFNTGLYLSTNAGQSWTALNNATSPVYGTFIAKVLPTTIGTNVANQTVLVGTQNGLFVSPDGGSTFAPQTMMNPVLDVVADPLSSVRFYLLAGPDSSGQGAGVYLSDNAGQSWTAINGGALDSTVLALIGTNGEFNGAGRLAATTQSGQTLLYMTFARSDNQNTYAVFRTAITAGGASNWQTYYTFDPNKAGGSGNNLGLAVDPSNPDIVYTSGYGDNATYRIEPDPANPGQGKPIELTNEDDGSLYDTRSLAFATDANGHLVLIQTSDSGVYSLTDPTTTTALPTWTPLMGNISVTESYSVAAAAGPLGQLYVGGGAQDTASFQTTITPGGQTSWVAVNGGDGYGSAFDPATGMFYATSDTLSGLQVAQAGTNTIEPVTFTGFNAADNGAGAFPSLVAVSAANVGGPFTPRPVLLAAFGLYQAIPAGLTSGQVTVVEIHAPSGSDTFSALSFGGTYQGAPDPYILYAAKGDGTLWFSNTFGAPATRLTSWTGGTIVGLQQDPANSHHVYALTKTALYVTENAGQTWTAYATPPPSSTLGPFLSLGLVPTTVGGAAANVLLVGGAHGAMVLPDVPSLGLSAWSPAGANLPNTIVTGFAYVPGLDSLVLSTFGQGDWLVGQASTQLLYAAAGQSTTVLSAPSTATWGNSMLLSAQVTAAAAGQPSPTGTVLFSARPQGGGNPLVLGLAPLNAASSAQLLLPRGLAPGSWTLQASYSGDGNFSVSQGQASTTIAPAVTQIGLTAPPTALPGSPVTLTAQVAGGGGGGGLPPAGIVTFRDGGKVLDTVVLNAAGVASLVVPSLAVGQHPLSASYVPFPDSPFAASQTATPLPLTVDPLATTVGLFAPTAAVTMLPVTLTAVVGASGKGAVAGTVTFYDGSTVLGAADVNATRAATFTIASLPAGTHVLRALFRPAPGSPLLPSPFSAPVTLRVTQNPTTTTTTMTRLTASAAGNAPLSRRLFVRFGVQVSGAAYTPGPASGLVELLADGQVLALSGLDARGRATILLPAARVMNRPILALYLGGSSGSHPSRPSLSPLVIPTVRLFRSPGQAAARLPHALSVRIDPPHHRR